MTLKLAKKISPSSGVIFQYFLQKEKIGPFKMIL